MPGFDGTGPRGMGPRTGWGRGRCPSVGYGYGAPYPYQGAPGVPGAVSYPYYGGGAPIAPGVTPYPYQGAPNVPAMSPEQELGFLQNQAGVLKQQLDDMMRRIGELEGQTQ